MHRKAFLLKSIGGLAGCCAAAAFGPTASAHQAPAAAPDPEKQFIQNWLADLLAAVDRDLGPAAKARLVGACGRACWERHAFKRNMPVAGRADVDKLITALKANFEAWREGATVHVRFGEVTKSCYCPAARYRPAKPNDLHCECSRGSHQAIWETEMGRPVRVEILESVRRGGKTCHFLVHV